MPTPLSPVAERTGRRTTITTRTTALVALGLLLLQAAFFLLLAGGDASRLVHAAPPYADEARTPSTLTVGEPDEGFDGQFFLRQALAPVSEADVVAGISMDLPALRTARVGYPLTAGALAWGRPALLPWSLLAVNLLAGAALALAVAHLARDAGRSPAWGVLAASYPGFAYTLGFDLSELLAGALLASGLLALRRARPALAALAWSGAILTRETAVVLPLAAAAVLGLQLLRGRRVALSSVLPAAVPLTVLVIWQAGLGLRFGEVPVLSSGEKNVGLPLAGLLSSAEGLRPDSPDGLFRLASLCCLVAVAVAAAWSARRSSASPTELVGLLGAAVMVSTISPFVWAGATSFMRAGTELALLSVTVAASSTSRARLLLPPVLLGTLLLTLASQLVK